MLARQRGGVQSALFNIVDTVDFIHRQHHRATMGGHDQHARHHPLRRGNGHRRVQPQQVNQRQTRHQRSAHVGHPLQGPRTLVWQRVNGLHARHFVEAHRVQAQPFTAQTEHHQRTCGDFLLSHWLGVEFFRLLLKRVAIQQARGCGGIHGAIAAMDVLRQLRARLVAEDTDAVPAVINGLGFIMNQALGE